RRRKRRWISRRTDDKAGDVAGGLRVQEKDRGDGIDREPVVPDVAGDANDLGSLLPGPGHRDALAERAPVAEVLPRKRLVHDHHPWAAGSIASVEAPPLQDWNAHRLEVAPADQRAIGRQSVVGIADWLAVEPERGAAVHPRERQELNGARGLHARHGLDMLENPVHDADPVLSVSVAEEEAHRDRVSGLESKTNTGEAREGP